MWCSDKLKVAGFILKIGTLKRLLPPFILLLLLAWRLPDLMEYGSVNRVAVSAVTGCYSNQTPASPDTNGLPSTAKTQVYWLKAYSARCLGDQKKQEAAMREMLAVSDSRLEMARRANPGDVAIAKFAASQYPNRADSHFWLGDALTARKDRDAAISAYKDGLALETNNAAIWLTVGVLYEKREKLHEAAKAYDEICLRITDFESRDGCRRAGQVYLKLGDNEAGVDRLQRCLKLLGYSWLPVERDLASALLSLGRTKEAIPHLEVLAKNGFADARVKLTELGK